LLLLLALGCLVAALPLLLILDSPLGWVALLVADVSTLLALTPRYPRQSDAGGGRSGLGGRTRPLFDVYRRARRPWIVTACDPGVMSAHAHRA